MDNIPSTNTTSSPLNIILSITRFIIFALLLVSFVMLFSAGGLIKSYMIGIFLILLIVSLCGYYNIANLGIFQNINFLTLLWCLPIVIVLIISRKELSDKTRESTDPLSIILTILLVLNFTIDSILQFIGTIVGWVARLSSVLLPILIGLILATIILSVVDPVVVGYK